MGASRRFRKRSYLAIALLVLLIFAWIDRCCHGTHTKQDSASLDAQTETRSHDSQPSSLVSEKNQNFTVNLVIASTSKDDTTTAQYRPPVPRVGREAMIYHTYFHDFYDSLPDLSIMIHPHEKPWHIEPALAQSMLFALNNLDLGVAHQRGYANLRVGWKESCPDWVDTSREYGDERRPMEAPYMAGAMYHNFGVYGSDLPRYFGGPCCSQFVVTKEAVHRHPREQYKRSTDWLAETSWPDWITGRTWEHMFPWMFTGNAVDCPMEWKVFCGMYHVCFKDPSTITDINDLWEERQDLLDNMDLWQWMRHPQIVMRSNSRVREIEDIVRWEVARAMARGQDEDIRRAASVNMFED
ncbi:uncharacterized protein E0L32_000724 [Thyridium curvatum]|uniref:Uncharacterized protein n=1 Tax=Thyridium curvatum TaxID=1093900 RepID=A0A507AYE7_9PEZI|nr:uncharacterized protein E0L32_000724 [Thyridium curvatum]TPX12547.1 hypothetical protein E0L32_000724 [Thyridium curvatum]